MRFWPTVPDLLLGLNVCLLGVAGIVLAPSVDRWTVGRICIAALNLVAGTLILLRGAARRGPTWFEIASVLPSFLAGGWAFQMAGSPSTWPWWINAAFVGGTAWTLWAFLTLGRSFSIAPADRGLVRHGPYAWIRHPAYAGELVLMTACCLAAGTTWSLAPLVLAIPAIVWRIQVEEQLLAESGVYDAYAADAPWRIVPGVW